MTEQPREFSRFDRDPEALAWARTKVQAYIDQLAEWEEQAKEREAGAKATGIAVSRLLAQRRLLGGGCVIGAFDERMPDYAKTIDNALPAPVDRAVRRDHSLCGVSPCSDCR